MMKIKPIEITAVFIGKDSCGFKSGETYQLWMFQKNGTYYLSNRSENATAIPYDTMDGIRKNWKMVSF